MKKIVLLASVILMFVVVNIAQAAGGLPEVKYDDRIKDCGCHPFCEEKVVKTKPAPAPVAKPKPAPVVVKVPEPAPAKEKVTITLNVEFDINKTTVKEKYYDDIKRVTDFMKENPDATAAIEGHTDNVGNDAFNKALSEKRANNVRQYMIDKFGIDGKRITATGFGEEVPIASNDTADGRQKNRRVEAVLETK
ncbi:MAG: OmpA family protein [Smithella sp.]